MSGRWPQVRLGEVLTLCKDFILIEEEKTYVRPRVQLHAYGVVQRDCVLGSDIKTKRQQVCHFGQFLVAEIDAKVGGYGMVPQSLDGAIVSSHYFLYNLKVDRVDPGYFAWFIRTDEFGCQVSAQGTTNYAAIRPNDVLTYEIPLPPLEEQRRIVEKIDMAEDRINAVCRLTREIDRDLDVLGRTLLLDGKYPVVELSELVELRSPDVIVQADEEYHFAGVYSFGRGVFRGQKKKGIEFSYPRLTRLNMGDFIYPKLMAWEGALGVVPPECDGLFVSTEFPVFHIRRNRILPELLDLYFKNPAIWPLLAGSSPGTNIRRRRLNPVDFLKLGVPLPEIEIQQKIAEISRRTTLISKIRVQNLGINSLLPSVLERIFNSGD